MQKHPFRPLLFFTIVLFTLSCATTKQVIQTSFNISSLKFLGVYEIPFNLQYNNTTVGGLSGIDYDEKNNLYYLICDDRSDKNPARFYTARIYFTQRGIDTVVLNGVINIRQPNGNVYPNSKQDRYHTPDPEAIRYNPVNRQLVWSSEGERIVKAGDTVLEDPAIIFIHQNGKYIDSFNLPA